MLKLKAEGRDFQLLQYDIIDGLSKQIGLKPHQIHAFLFDTHCHSLMTYFFAILHTSKNKKERNEAFKKLMDDLKRNKQKEKGK